MFKRSVCADVKHLRAEIVLGFYCRCVSFKTRHSVAWTGEY